MIVVKETSKGRVVLTFTYVSRSIGLTAGVGRVGDQGWVEETVNWSSGASDDGSLANAIAEAASVPNAEAEQLAESALRELHDRGGDKSEMTRRDWLYAGALLTTSAGIIFVVIVAVIAALVLVAIKLI